MDQIKIGRFIAECRKKNGLTQMQLAEQLNITDRAVSKWENGRSLPDSSIMLKLCQILKINVNDLLNGEVITVEQYNEQNERLLVELAQQKEEADKRLLALEVLIGVLSIIILLGAVFTASFFPMRDWVRICIILVAFAVSLVGIGYAIKIEQTAGYYECAKCRHRYVPTFKSVLGAMHMGRTRYMRCPKCGQRSWQRKVIGRGNE